MGSLDPLEVSGGRLEAGTLEATLDRILRTHTAAVVLALDEQGNRVPLPDDNRFGTCRGLPTSGKTVMDYVVAQDRMAVVTCWERAQTVGLGQARVRLSHPSEPAHNLLIIDVRPRHGVWIEVLVPQTDGPVGAQAGPQIRLPPPSRARTAVMHKSLAAVIVAIDDRTTSLFGFTADSMVGHRSLDFIHPDDQERAIGQWLEMRSHRASQRVRVRHRRRDDTWLWVEIENEYLGRDDPDGVVAVARVTDVSEEMAAVEALRQQETLFRRLTESLPVGVIQIDPERRVVYVNTSACALLGGESTASWPELVAHIESGGVARLEQRIAHAVDGAADDQLEATVLLPGEPQGRQYLFAVVGLPGPEGTGTGGVLVSVADVTDSVRLREQLRLQATHDPLTGCLNRAAVLAALDEALSGPDAAGVAVIFLDLDGFKIVNDTAGHAVGDELLCRIGRRLISLAGHDDRVGRLGGDEFLVLCTDVRGEDAALAVAEQLRARLSAPLQLPAGRFSVHASLGVARARAGISGGALVAQADQAMYRAKQVGGSSSHLDTASGEPSARPW